MPKNDLVKGIDLQVSQATFNAAGSTSGAASAMEVHDLDGVWHTGTLPWADIDTAGSNLTDIATRPHSALSGIGANDHHNQSHVLATNAALGADHTISGATSGHVLRASSATAAAFAAIADGDLPSTIVRTSRTITSGAGLTGGGDLSANRTLAVGAGDGITVNADDVALASTVAGAGLTFSAGVVAVGAGLGITVNADDVALASTVAGAGLTFSAGVVAVGAGAGLTVNADDVALTTPGSLTVATSNSASGSHTHAITSSSNPGAAASLLASTGSGGLTLQSLAVQGNVDITSGGDLTVGANILFVDVSQVSVGINGAPDPQFALDVYGPARAEYWIGPHALQIKNALLIAHFDGRQPFETNFSGERNGHMGQVATIAGGAIWREGKFNKAIQIAPATTNLITNPSFETNTTSWAAFGGASITRSASGGSVTGSYVLVVNRPSSTTDGVSYTHFTSTQGTYYFSFSVKASGTHIGKKVYAFMRFSYSDATFTDTTAYNHTLTGEWERIYSSGTTNGAKILTHITLFARDLSGGGTAHTWLMDSVQLELDQLTPYCDGSMGDGHSWSGTAHASTSSRTAATLSYPTSGNINPLAGTVAAWIKPSKVSGTHYILRIDGSGSSYIILRYAGGVAGAYWGTAGVNGTTAIPIETWSHLAMTYDGATVTIYLNGQLETSIASSGFATMPASMQVGHASSASHLNGLLDDLLITSDCKTATEILAIYESNAPVFAETAKYGFRATPLSLVWADDEGLWVRNTSGQAVMGVYAGEAATKSWGGVTMANADILIGDSSRNGYMLWDDSAGTLAMRDTTIEFYQSGTRFIRINSTNGIGIEGDQTGSESYNDYRSYSITSGGVAHGGLFGATNVASTWKRIYLLARGDTTYAPTLYLYSSRSAPGGTNSATTQVAALSENSSTADFGQALLTLTALSATSGGTADLTAAGGITMSASVGGITLAGSSAGVTATGGLYSSTVYGGKNANDDITIHGTSNATRTTSYVILQPTAGNVGIAQTTPTSVLHVTGTVSLDGATVINDTGAAAGDFRVESDTEANFIWLDADGSTNGILYLGGSANRVQIEQGGVLSFQGTAKIKDGTNIPLDTTTGTKLGTATTQKLGFWNATPIVRPSAFTQTYATASKTHSNLTYVAPAAYGAGANGYSTAAMAAAVHAAVIALAADVANVKQVLNSVIDDLQSMGLLA